MEFSFQLPAVPAPGVQRGDDIATVPHCAILDPLEQKAFTMASICSSVGWSVCAQTNHAGGVPLFEVPAKGMKYDRGDRSVALAGCCPATIPSCA